MEGLVVNVGRCLLRWRREAYLDLMTFQGGGGRAMFSELFGPLVGLAEEWRAQGASEEEIGMVGFDWDYVPYAGCGGRAGPVKRESVTISETSEELIQRDYLGRTVKLIKKTATIPLPMDFPVKTMEDWLRVKPLFVFSEERVDEGAVAKARALQAEGHVVVGGMAGAFDIPRELMGEELACLAYYEQPELMADIVATLTETAVKVFERVCEKVVVDQLSVHEDLAGRSGPMVGPSQIEAYFKPYYSRVWEIVKGHGGRIFRQDTDGNINAIIPALLDCGLTSIYPMEPAAGMDVVALREKYGKRLAMLGGIDKHVLRKSRGEIERELEYKMAPALREGMVFGLDHRIPNGTPLENYRYYVKRGREILGLPEGRGRGWGRMAF